MPNPEKIVVMKPVASRPFSNFRSFSKLLEDSMITGASPASFPEAAVPIRPKTMRFRSPADDLPAEVTATMDDVSGSPVCHPSDNAAERGNSKLAILHRPPAKAVPTATASFIASLDGNSDGTQEQMANDLEQMMSYDHLIQPLPHADLSMCSIPDPASSAHHDMRQQQTSSADRPSYDGYNWRKYGQKQVKGSEFPRSYYKCTHPNCPVKKKVERSLDGQIAEIVYKGEHNHLKPHPPKRLPSAITEVNVTDAGVDCAPYDPLVAAAFQGSSTSLRNCSYMDGFGEMCEVGSLAETMDRQKPECKKSKKDNHASDTGSLTASVEPPPALQSSMESDISGDGFHWRKYGQKVVKGNSYPRSYYRCSTPKCNVRKYVERASDDSGSSVTTYEGKHNHDMPIRRTN